MTSNEINLECLFNDTINNPVLTDSSPHILTLFSIAISLKAKTIVELGVRNGGTTLPLLMAAKVNNGLLHSVDIKNIAFPIESTLVPFWKPYPNTDAINFLESWNKNHIIDLIFVDDWHSYDHVKKELDIIDRLVSPKSVILLHDTMYGHWAPHYHCDLSINDGQWASGGPYRAIAELDKNFWEFSTIPVNHGLTILRKKYSNKYHY